MYCAQLKKFPDSGELLSQENFTMLAPFLEDQISSKLSRVCVIVIQKVLKGVWDYICGKILCHF